MSAVLFDSPLVKCYQLKRALDEVPERVRVLDGSWFLGTDKKPKEEYLKEHIPGALFFDINEICYKPSPLPHMLPRAEAFAKAAADMGISNSHHVVIYNTENCFSAARVWWTFQIFGHDAVHILQGGLPQWRREGFPVESGAVAVRSTRQGSGVVVAGQGCVASGVWKLDDTGFQACLRPKLYSTWRNVAAVSAAAVSSAGSGSVPVRSGGHDGDVSSPSGGASAGAETSRGDKCAVAGGGQSVRRADTHDGQIADARPRERFAGRAPEPRAGLRAGHIPGSACLPVVDVFAPGDLATFQTPDEIRVSFAAAGVDLAAPGPLITTCGSGVMAAALTFAAYLAGRNPAATPVYDGSWAEWGSREDLPVAEGDSALPTLPPADPAAVTAVTPVAAAAAAATK